MRLSLKLKKCPNVFVRVCVSVCGGVFVCVCVVGDLLLGWLQGETKRNSHHTRRLIDCSYMIFTASLLFFTGAYASGFEEVCPMSIVGHRKILN